MFIAMPNGRMGEFIGWRARYALGRAKHMVRRKHECGRVLCLLRGGLGDKLMALPAIRSFRREFGGKELTVIVEGTVPPFFEREADQLLTIGEGQHWRKLLYASRGFDACFVNSIGLFDVWSEVAAFISRANISRGPRTRDQAGHQTVYTEPYLFGSGHETVVNLRGAGGKCSEERVPYPLKIHSEPDAPLSRRVIIHPGSSAFGTINRWSAANFAHLGRVLADAGLEVLAVGTESEKELLRELSETSQGTIRLLIGQSLEKLAVELKKACFVVANDSGIGHLAAAVGARLITLMGPNRPELVGPIGTSVTILRATCPHGGCYGTPLASECLGCIDSITPDLVAAEILPMMQRMPEPVAQ